MFKTKIHSLNKLISALAILVILITNSGIAYSATTASVAIGAILYPSDVTNLTATDTAPGTGEVILTWTTSTTPNINIQRIEITGPQGPGVNFTTKDVPFQIIDGGVGPNAADNYTNYAPFINITGLTIGETYIIKIVSIAGALESPGLAPDAQVVFIPAAANPAPVLLAEPATTQGNTNELFWTNGGITDATLECRITASLTDLNVDPLGAIIKDSGWAPCPDPATTYSYNFTGLSYTTYYYHVQSRSTVDGLSPYSNVELSRQITTGGSSGGGGGVNACGNGFLDPLEQCDDGNTISGDGCSANCINEPAICGNLRVEAGEQCDDGNLVSNDGCSSTCQNDTALLPAAAECGDGILDPVEQCDDGNKVSGDGCSATCTNEASPTCGDGNLDAGEQCDDGNYANGDGCDFVCKLEPAVIPEQCGNAIVEAPETCDDGNLTNGDGCTDVCEIEEIVEIVLEIKGKPEYRISNYGQTSLLGDIVSVTNANTYRINNTPNLGLNSGLGVFKPSINNLDILSLALDDFGEAQVTVQIVTGQYDFALNGESHNTRVLKGFTITPDTERVVLDFTKNETQVLVTGDTFDDNYVNSQDIANMLGSYKSQTANKNDLNKDQLPIVNALDVAILIWNYKAEGEYL